MSNQKLERHLGAVRSQTEASAEPKSVQVQIPVPLALAFGIFDTVIGACNSGAQALTNMSNPDCAKVLLSIAEELQLRAKTMLIEQTRKVQIASPAEMPPDA